MLEKYDYNGQLILPPKADIIFKAIFGTEDSKDLLAVFLNDMLHLDIAGGYCIELLNTELLPAYEDGKLVRLDVRARLRNGENVDVEIQVNDKGDTIPRNVFCNDKLFISQLKKGGGYFNLQKAISLIIVDFHLFKNKKNWYNKFKYKEVETGDDLTDLKELAFIELPKWAALKRKPEDILRDANQLRQMERWNLFLSTNSGEVLNMLAEKDETMRQAVEKLMAISADEKLQYEYDQRLISELDHYSRVTHAMEKGLQQGLVEGRTKGLVEGRTKGLEEGRAKGLEEGIEKGLTKGLARGLEEGFGQGKLAVARNLKLRNLSDEEIAEATELPLEEIRDLNPEA